MVLPLPGNSTKEQNFYEQQAQPIPPGVEWPGTFEVDAPNGQPLVDVHPAPIPDPSPFKIERK